MSWKTGLTVAAGFLCWATGLCGAETVTVDPRDSVIVVRADARPSQRNAAEELSRHLKLVAGASVAIRNDKEPRSDGYHFFVGIAPPGKRAPTAAGAPEHNNRRTRTR